MGDFWIPIIVLIATFVFSMPISLGLISSAVLYLLATGADIGIVADRILNGMYGNYTIMAVPMFVLMANVMNTGDITHRMFSFCKACIGRKRGALAHVNILFSMIFAGMSGSAVADTSGIGTIEIEAMRKEGYDVPFSAALSSATSTVGPIIPPSIPMVIYAMLSGASVGKLFVGGVIPGVLLCLFLSVYVTYISKKREYPRGTRYQLKEFLLLTVRALPALLTVVVLLVGIYGGIMTPTESSAVAAAYAILVSMLVYRSFNFKQFASVIRKTALQTGRITIMTAASCVISYMVANEGIAAKVAVFVLSVTENKYLLLFLINVVFLMLGMIIDAGVIQYVFLPLVLPIVTALGINLIHFGVMIILNMMIGLSTPPFGMCLFISANVSNGNLKDISREIIPMVAVMIVFLFLVAFFPAIVTFLPSVLS